VTSSNGFSVVATTREDDADLPPEADSEYDDRRQYSVFMTNRASGNLSVSALLDLASYRFDRPS